MYLTITFLEPELWHRVCFVLGGLGRIAGGCLSGLSKRCAVCQERAVEVKDFEKAIASPGVTSAFFAG